MRFEKPRMASYASLVFTTVLALGLAACNNDADPLFAQTTKGGVRGVEDDQIVKFMGIPYAAAPTGDLRFRPPQPRTEWTEVLDASIPGPACPQGQQQETEDCLYLNVWRPITKGSKRPVYVWVHGGGFTRGTGASVDGSALALAADALVVTINYRMGIFGYLANTDIETTAGDSGNYGVQDTRAALEWVRDNIAAFGGDPNNVTLGGSSAGAMTTCLSTASPQSKDLFQKAIVQSGPCSLEWPTIGTKYTQEASVPAALGCTGTSEEIAQCLRSPELTVADILAVQDTLPSAVMFPSVGGTVVPVQPRTLLGSKPMLMGFAEYEILPFDFSFNRTLGGGMPNPTDDASYLSALQPLFGEDAEAVRAAYPLMDYATGNLALNTIEADIGPTAKGVYIAVCESVRSFEEMSANGGSPVFAYEFNDPNAPPSPLTTMGPVHGWEGAYIFPKAPLPGASESLSKTIIAYWANFLRTNDPNGSDLPLWPAYASSTDVIQLVPGAVATGKDASMMHKCPFWNSL